jgi:flagellar motor switch protein FliM
MEDKHLSREDVDSLLQGGGASTANHPESEAESGKPPAKVRVLAYDFRRPERVGKELVRGLQSLHEGLARNFGASLSAILRSMVEVRLISVDQLTYREFIQSLEIPTCFNLLRPKPLERNWVLDISPALLYPIIDRMLGGGSTGESNLNRPLSEIELRLAGRITQLFLRELRTAWLSILSLDLEIERVESNPQLVHIVPPNERVASKLTSSSWIGYAGTSASEASQDQMANRLDGSLVNVVVTLARSQIKTGDLFDLQVGDIISTEKDIQQPLEVEIADAVKFLAAPGSLKGRKAIKIESVVNFNNSESRTTS